MINYVICTREVKKNKFTAEPGITRFLTVPDKESPNPKHEIPREEWFKAVQAASVWGADSRFPERDRGDVLFFVHGYNNSQKDMIRRHRRLDLDLKNAGFLGVVISYDWPSNDIGLNYLEDRHDAKKTALQLVSDGIKPFAAMQRPDCSINVHLLGHSTGAYVIREAFDDADDVRLINNAWMISQLIFISGDVSAASMSEENPITDSLYRHCIRFTNYSNIHDSVLKLSNIKRVGVAPRVGRLGLPKNIPQKAVNVDCSKYFAHLDANADIRKVDQTEEIGSFNHSWQIGNKIFALDLFQTLIGDADRAQITTREKLENGALGLKIP